MSIESSLNLTIKDLMNAGFSFQLEPGHDSNEVFSLMSNNGFLLFKAASDPEEQRILKLVGAKRYSEVEEVAQNRQSPSARKPTEIHTVSIEDFVSETSEKKFSILSALGTIGKTALMVPVILGGGLALAVAVPLILLIGIPLLLVIGLPIATIAFLIRKTKDSDTKEASSDIDMGQLAAVLGVEESTEVPEAPPPKKAEAPLASEKEPVLDQLDRMIEMMLYY